MLLTAWDRETERVSQWKLLRMKVGSSFCQEDGQGIPTSIWCYGNMLCLIGMWWTGDWTLCGWTDRRRGRGHTCLHGGDLDFRRFGGRASAPPPHALLRPRPTRETEVWRGERSLRRSLHRLLLRWKLERSEREKAILPCANPPWLL